MKDAPQILFEFRPDWRKWLAENHAASKGIFVITWRKGAGKPILSYDDMVEEALCFGWIDSLPRKLDDQRTMLYFSPRKKGSPWSGLNKERIIKLEAEGLIEEPGRRLIEAAKQDGSWESYDAAQNLIEPLELAEGLDANSQARKNWDAFPPSARRGILWIIYSAKTEATKSKRIAETIRLAEKNLRAFTPGLKE
jgi:uncharacterized protein YdeI (YjbR/CyaY-like superfamily)